MRMKFFVCLVLLAAGLAGAGQTANRSVPAYVVPFELYRDAVWLKVTVNGSAPLSFILDSAAGRCVVARAAAEKLKMFIVEQGVQNVSPAENTVKLGASPNVRFGIGGAEITTHAAVVPFEVPSDEWGKRFDGAIGYELFAAWVVALDFDARKITLYDPETFEYQGPSAVVPLRIVQNKPIVRARFGLPGTGPIEGDFEVDSGGSSSIVFTSPFVREHDLIAASQRMVPRLIDSPHIGVGGTARRVLGRVEFVEVGPYRVRNPIAGFIQAESGSLAKGNVAGILGCFLLHRFNVIFDYRRSRLILAPNSHFAEPPDEYDMSGMELRARGEDYGEIYVMSVTPGSPAAANGVQAGDVLLAVDGKPLKGMPLRDVARLFTKDGAERRVQVDRAGQRRTFRFVLRRVL